MERQQQPRTVGKDLTILVMSAAVGLSLIACGVHVQVSSPTAVAFQGAIQSTNETTPLTASLEQYNNNLAVRVGYAAMRGAQTLSAEARALYASVFGTSEHSPLVALNAP